MLQTLTTKDWDQSFTPLEKAQAINMLEGGRILYFPELAFTLSPEELAFLTPDYADPHAKNISYHAAYNKLWGVQQLTDKQHIQLKTLLDRFSRYALGLVHRLLPAYAAALCVARTSVRPVEVSGSKTSYRKDDKRLHIDAFPSAPNQGKRILRVFSNINPHHQDRVWHVGEPFEKVAQQFLPKVKKPLPGKAALLRLLKITKSYRTMYDHYMLHIHDSMKADEAYQQQAPQQEIRFAPGSSWIVQTDHVSHAALQGQYVLEQTFYLPVSAMQDASLSPLRVLERLLNCTLV